MRLKSWIQLCMWFGNALWRRVYGSSAAQQMLAGRLCFWGDKGKAKNKSVKRRGAEYAESSESGMEKQGQEPHVRPFRVEHGAPDETGRVHSGFGN